MIRAATLADLPALAPLYAELDRDQGGPAFYRETFDDQRERVERHVREGGVLVWEEDGQLAGFVEAGRDTDAVWWVDALHVRAPARRRGVGRALLAAAAAGARGRGATHLALSVAAWNEPARALYDRLGFDVVGHELAVPLDALDARLAEPPAGPTFGSVHVQTDDAAAVERAVAQFLPRLGGSGGTEVAPPRSGWVAVYDERCDRDATALRRLARELSDRMGAVVLQLGVEAGAVARYVLWDRGRVADEYASVPEFHGELAPGDVVAMGANPTVAHRLTGADPARVREVARTAASPAELPPAVELVAQLAAALGVEGGDRGYRA